MTGVLDQCSFAPFLSRRFWVLLVGLTVQKLLGVERLLLAPDLIDRSTDLGFQDRQCLAFATLAFLTLHPRFHPRTAAQHQRCRLAERPLQMSIANLPPWRAFLLAGTLVFATYQSGIAQKVAVLGEALDVLNLVEQDQAQHLADARQRLQQVIRLGIVDLGVLDQVLLEFGDGRLILVDQCGVGTDGELGGLVGKAIGQVAVVGMPGQLAFEGRQVVLAVGVGDVGDELGFLPHEEGSTPQQVAGFTHGTGINKSHREHAAAQQPRDLGSINAIAFGLAAVDSFHVEGVSEREGDGVIFARIGEPIPGEHAFAADDQSLAKGLDGVEEDVGIGEQVFLEDGFAVLIEDVGEHTSCMQVNAAIVLML